MYIIYVSTAIVVYFVDYFSSSKTYPGKYYRHAFFSRKAALLCFSLKGALL